MASRMLGGTEQMQKPNQDSVQLRKNPIPLNSLNFYIILVGEYIMKWQVSTTCGKKTE
jgi:hypothetical protein